MKFIQQALLVMAWFSALTLSAAVQPQQLSATLKLKTPGNAAKEYTLALNGKRWEAKQALPVSIVQNIAAQEGDEKITLTLTATDDVYFHFSEHFLTGVNHREAQFYLPGFWYRQNLRSPKESPSFHTSDSWIFREDRLSTALVAVFDPANANCYSIMRSDEHKVDVLTTHTEGQVILSGKTSVGHLGFTNVKGKSALTFGFPYAEAPKDLQLTYNEEDI